MSDLTGMNGEYVSSLTIHIRNLDTYYGNKNKRKGVYTSFIIPFLDKMSFQSEKTKILNQIFDANHFIGNMNIFVSEELRD
jgi:hypothetical protein